MGSAPRNPQILGTSSGTSATDYEVFVNFRGADVRPTLIDVLRFFMKGAGIRYFYDDESMRIGDVLSEELMHGIRNARVYLVVLTPNYAKSKWCLKELAYMVKCGEDGERRRGDRLILPVFYGVRVEDVKIRDEVDSLYKTALNGLEARREDKEEWGAALGKVTAIKGFRIESSTGIIGVSQKIVEELRDRLKMRHLSYHLVGADEQVRQLEEILHIESGDVRFLVIYGNRGTGKTTLAREVFLQISHRFQGSSFLREIREMSDRYGFKHLKHKLLRDMRGDHDATIEESCREKKVLIVLDNVDNWRQIEELAGSSTWFGPGSRILITASNELFSSTQDEIKEWCVSNKPSYFQIKKLDKAQQHRLFSRYAFGQDSPLNGFTDLSHQIVVHCEDLPLVLEVMGSLLRRERNETRWKEIIESLKRCGNVQEKLKISYNALSDDSVKSVFLDIACFFVNEEKTNPTYMWSTDRPEEGLAELLMSSLVKIVDGDKLWMHHYLRDIGRAIVARNSCFDHHQLCCWGRCRYWVHGEAEKVLKCEKDMKVEAICLYDQQVETLELKAQNFSNKKQLRFLRLHPVEFEGDFRGKLNSLRWISWHRGPEYFKATEFASESLVILDLARSLIDDNWGGWKELKGKSNLRVIDLTCCQNLTRMPDFSEFTHLERLILEDCSKLVNIGPSIGVLTNLRCLNVKGCDSLKELPKEIESLKALTEILISKKNPGPFSLPDEIGNLKSLTILEIVNVEMTSSPLPIGGLEKLERLSMLQCSGFQELEIGKLTSLVEMEISDTQITSLPESVGHLQELKVIKMEQSKLRSLPSAISKLAKLEELHARDSEGLEGTIPEGIGELQCLRILDLSGTKVDQLPKTVNKLSHLQKLQLPSCCSISNWSDLPKSLTYLRITFPAQFSINGDPNQPERLPKLEKLQVLELHIPDGTSYQMRLCDFAPQLKSLHLSFQVKQEMQCCLPLPENISKLILQKVKVRMGSPDIRNLKKLSSLDLRECVLSDGNESGSSQPEESGSNQPDAAAILFDVESSSLVHFSASSSHFSITSGLELRPPQGLRVLCLKECDFSNSKLQLSGLLSLKQLTVWRCRGLIQVEGLRKMEQLENLEIRKCEVLESLSGDIPNSKRLKVIRISGNNQLINIEGNKKPISKVELSEMFDSNMASTLTRSDTIDHRDIFEEISGNRLSSSRARAAAEPAKQQSQRSSRVGTRGKK